MSAPETTSETITEHLDPANLPTLYADRSFWGMTVTQFFGAFNDNLFKQLILLLSITILADGTTQDNQGTATLIFSLPFLLVTGIAGYLSDRYPKRGIIVLCKIAEIAVMALGALAFAYHGKSSSLAFLYLVLFLMGAQSGFFGPAKYGILPEMLRDDDLPRANGLILMTTFIAIITGTVVAGLILDYFPGKLWVGSSRVRRDRDCRHALFAVRAKGSTGESATRAAAFVVHGAPRHAPHAAGRQTAALGFVGFEPVLAPRRDGPECHQRPGKN